MKLIYDYGQVRVRQTLISYKSPSDGFLHNLLCIFEVLEPDMQDYNEPDMNAEYRDLGVQIKTTSFDAEGRALRIFLDVAKASVNLSTDMLRMPEGDDLYAIYSRDFEDNPLSAVAPYRVGPCYAVSYIDKGETLKRLEVDGVSFIDICNAIKSNLGAKIELNKELVGSVHLIWHHPWLRSFDLRASDDPAGVLVMAEVRDDKPHTVVVTLEDKSGENVILQDKTYTIDELGRCQLLRLPQPANKLSVKVYDSESDLIYGLTDVSFIRQINVNIGVFDNITKAKGGKLHTERLSIGAAKESAARILVQTELKQKATEQIETALSSLSYNQKIEVLENCMRNIKMREADDNGKD